MTTANRSSDPPVGRSHAADYFRKATELLLDFAYAMRVEPDRPKWDPTESG
ncbi:MAG: hypothetical protein ACRDHJ_00130 [Actinomycetota bacterium]